MMMVIKCLILITMKQEWTQTCHLYLFVLLLCIVSLSLYYTLDAPAGMEGVLISTLSIDVTRYTLLYSLSSIPTVFIAFFGGKFADSFGVTICIIFFVVMSAVGQLIVACGSLFAMYWIIVLGYVVIGVGSEMALITIDAYFALKFKEREVVWVFSILEAVGLFGSAMGIYFNYFIYEWLSFITNLNERLFYTMLAPLLLQILACVVAIVFSLLVRFFDGKSSDSISDDDDDCDDTPSCYSLLDAFKFELDFWLLFAITVIYYSVLYAFQGIAQFYFVSKFGLYESQANLANALSILIPIASPCFGIIIHLVGFDMYWGLSGLALLLGSHVMLAVCNGNVAYPYIASSMIGLAHCMFDAIMWSAPSKMLPEDKFTTAYGILTSGCALGESVVYFSQGLLNDFFGFFIMEIFFLLMTVLAVGLAILFMLYAYLTRTDSFLITMGCALKMAKIRYVKFIKH